MKDNIVRHEGWRVGHEGQCSRARGVEGGT